jgi:hypothetical protein
VGITQGLCGYQSSVYAAWKGVVGDEGLYFGVLTDSTWDDRGSAIPGNSNVGPALAATASGLIYAAWKGKNDDQRLFYAWYDASTDTWSGQTQIQVTNGPSPTSSLGPSLAAIGNTLYAAWTGANDDLTPNFASFDASTSQWSSVPGISGSAGIVATSVGPSLAAIESTGTLYAAWQSPTRGFYYAWFDPSTNTWSGPAQTPNPPNSNGLSLAAIGGTLYFAWKSGGNSENIYYSSFDTLTNSWSGNTQISNAVTSIGPSLAALGNTLYAIWIGPGNDQTLYYASYDTSAANPSWSTPTPTGGSTGQDLVPPPIAGLGGNSNKLHTLQQLQPANRPKCHNRSYRRHRGEPGHRHSVKCLLGAKLSSELAADHDGDRPESPSDPWRHGALGSSRQEHNIRVAREFMANRNS